MAVISELLQLNSLAALYDNQSFYLHNPHIVGMHIAIVKTDITSDIAFRVSNYARQVFPHISQIVTANYTTFFRLPLRTDVYPTPMFIPWEWNLDGPPYQISVERVTTGAAVMSMMINLLTTGIDQGSVGLETEYLHRFRKAVERIFGQRIAYAMGQELKSREAQK